MNISNAERARVLVHALPYIQDYAGKIVVVKYGGNAMTSEKLKDSVMRDIVLLWLIGIKVVLVHGGGPEITDMLQKTGKKSEFVNGLRVTDKETADIVQPSMQGFGQTEPQTEPGNGVYSSSRWSASSSLPWRMRP